jgi:hypothetical protein
MSQISTGITSIYIPHVDISITKEEIVNILEIKHNLGIVEKIECIPKKNIHDGHDYNSCFVFFEKWNESENAEYFLSRLRNGIQTRLYYEERKYWVICLNKSEVAFFRDPLHMDLTVRTHPDITYETINSVMEGLDLGKVHSITMEEDDTQKYEVEWGNVNKNIWDEKVKSTCKLVRITFEFWYRTKTSYNFQSNIQLHNYVVVPVTHGMYMTFYREKASLQGNNPNVWRKMPKLTLIQ